MQKETGYKARKRHISRLDTAARPIIDYHEGQGTSHSRSMEEISISITLEPRQSLVFSKFVPRKYAIKQVSENRLYDRQIGHHYCLRI